MGMRFSPAGALGAGIQRFMIMGKKYGIEWWILVAGAIIVLSIVFMAFFAPAIAPFGPHEQDTGPQLAPPNQVNLMGTDTLQRDVWSRIVFGSGTILRVASMASVLSAIFGITLGLISGFTGGPLDRVLSLVMDSIFSFPGLILAIALTAMLGPGIFNITMAVAFIYIPVYFRMIRGQTLSVREELYVEAARAIGAPKRVILWKYVFPNVIATTVVVFTLNMADAIMIEAALTYLGLGLPPSIVDWGMDLAMGKKFLASGQWWVITFPGMMISLLTLGVTMLGEGLAEVLNPRLLER